MSLVLVLFLIHSHHIDCALRCTKIQHLSCFKPEKSLSSLTHFRQFRQFWPLSRFSTCNGCFLSPFLLADVDNRKYSQSSNGQTLERIKKTRAEQRGGTWTERSVRIQAQLPRFKIHFPNRKLAASKRVIMASKEVDDCGVGFIKPNCNICQS